VAIPVFGLLANLACMIAYLALPFNGIGTWKEPFIALGIAGLWALYGGIYFIVSSKKKGKSLLATKSA
jgi:hypothetical protein